MNISARSYLWAYFKTHNRATFAMLRKHLSQFGLEKNHLSFALHEMMRNGELIRVGQKWDSQYIPSDYMKSEFKKGNARPGNREPISPSIRLFDQLLMGVRCGK